MGLPVRKNTSPMRITRKRYDRLATFYDLMEKPLERLQFAQWRAKLGERIHGDSILEVGIGTGKNIYYYPKHVKVTAIDISPRMLSRATRKVGASRLDVNLAEMDVQNLAFSDRSFDTVFATFVFCSVPDPVKGLRELHRVCRPGGRLFLLEHMRPSNPILGFLFDRLNPLVVRMMGANINRRTVENIYHSGWKVLVEEDLLSDVVKWIEAEPVH
jgi:phosphatidylethanolamine/phosphatidyl-N-methylethanolamine N-methyltransferase